MPKLNKKLLLVPTHLSHHCVMSIIKLIKFFTCITQCKANWSNWIFYHNYFVSATKAAQLQDYIVETAAPPIVPVAINPLNPTKEEFEVIICHLSIVRLWHTNKSIAKQAMTSTILDRLFLRVKAEPLAGKM